MSSTNGCIPCEEDDFAPHCGGTTRNFSTTTCTCTVLSENESVSMDCKPMFAHIHKFNGKVCGCHGSQNLRWKITDLPDPLNGILYIGNSAVLLNQEISEQQNGLLYFARVKATPFSDTFRFRAVADCGQSSEYTVTVTATCECEEIDPCDPCTTCG